MKPATGLLLLIALTGAFAQGCGVFKACSEIAKPGVEVVVKDATTGAEICNATVTLRDGNYVDTIDHAPSGDASASACPYGGALERTGTYAIDVTAPGYRASSLAGVVVTNGECGVNTVPETITLDPGP